MDNDRSVEQQIQAEIEQLRARFPQTQDLYREVCVLLFFRYGITPTANKLYQLVRKGSMSAPAEALARFWTDLREKSRVRIEHPDLPEELRRVAGEMIAAVWAHGQAEAQESLATLRQEAQASVQEAQSRQAAAELERNSAQEGLRQVQEVLVEVQERLRSTETRLAAEEASRRAAEGQLAEREAGLERLQQALEDARRDFAGELEKQREATRLVEERFHAAEERALLEIDRERQGSARLQKELSDVRADAAQAAERHRGELTAAQADAGQWRQRVGVLEGQLQAAVEGRERQTEELAGVREQLATALSVAATRQIEIEHLQKVVSRFEEIAQPGNGAGKTARPRAGSKAKKSDK